MRRVRKRAACLGRGSGPGIPATNDGSEQAIRPVVVNRDLEPLRAHRAAASGAPVRRAGSSPRTAAVWKAWSTEKKR